MKPQKGTMDRLRSAIGILYTKNGKIAMAISSPPDVRYLRNQEPIMNLTPSAPASPSDVRRGSAAPPS